MLKQLTSWLNRPRVRVQSDMVATRPVARVTTRPQIAQRRALGEPVKVQVDSRPLWVVRGWRRNAKTNVLIGAFRTEVGSFVGNIHLAKQKRPEFYIKNPPPALLAGSHSACFRPRGDGWYFVHFGLTSANLDAGIVGIEKLIVQALRGRRQV